MQNLSFNFYMPVKIISGKGCVKNNAKELILGSRCLIVTGRSSARLSGALEDVAGVFGNAGIAFEIFERVRENPEVSVCEAGGRAASAFGADFIVGIGGGSALDAAKAVAAFAANPAVTGEGLFVSAKNAPLPLAVIPTTAGTGSEANNYAVLTLDGQNKKRTFKTARSYPDAAFLDASYTESLGREYTLSTALDAFCHCIESYMSPRSTVFSHAAAVWAASRIWAGLADLKEGSALDFERRERLLYASCAAGAAINVTGTGFPHPLGYNLTMYRSIPHGRACAAFTGEFIDWTKKGAGGAELIGSFCDETGIAEDEIKTAIPALAAVDLKLDGGDIALFVEKVRDASNFVNNPYVISEAEMAVIYKKLFC